MAQSFVQEVDEDDSDGEEDDIEVCYYGQHYHCFAYSHENEQWVMYDDKTVKVIGGWDDVLSMCERGHLQPQVLLFEAVN